MTFKKGYIEVCLTTEDGIQHLRCHGWLKRDKVLIKSEQVFGDKHSSAKDFGMFIIVVPSEELMDIMEYQNDMFTDLEVLSKEDERWDTYKKIKDKDFIQNIQDFMFSLAPKSKIDIDEFTNKANEATLSMFKSSKDFTADYVLEDFMEYDEKISDISYLISYFEELERYEDCAHLLKIKDKIVANEEFKSK
tara:strand:- start:42 stop:617 length:576 start_codon:yes stop_codon:yes gene_type:complete